MKENKNKTILPATCENLNNVSVTVLDLDQVGVKISNDFEGGKPVIKIAAFTLKCIMLRKTVIFIQWSKMTNKIANETIV